MKTKITKLELSDEDAYELITKLPEFEDISTPNRFGDLDGQPILCLLPAESIGLLMQVYENQFKISNIASYRNHSSRVLGYLCRVLFENGLCFK